MLRLSPTNTHSKLALSLNDYWLKCTQSKKILPLLFLTSKAKHLPIIIYVLGVVYVLFGFPKHSFDSPQDFAFSQDQLDCLRQHLLFPLVKC